MHTPLLLSIVLSLTAATAALATTSQPPQQQKSASAFSPAEKLMLNDARQLAAACQQFMLETASEKVSFKVDPETGVVSGQIAAYVQKITPGTKAIDGTLNGYDDTFSLQNPAAFGGAVVVFDAEGKMKQ